MHPGGWGERNGFVVNDYVVEVTQLTHQVIRVHPGGWGERCGFVVNDYVVEVDGEDFLALEVGERFEVLERKRPLKVVAKRPASVVQARIFFCSYCPRRSCLRECS